MNDLAVAIALDMDGVLLRSNTAKFRAMLGLFQEHPTNSEEISQFILANGGVPRAEKLTHILESIIGIPAPQAVLNEYLSRYEVSLEEALSEVALVPGVLEFLSTCECPLYLCSSAPPEEVSRQLVGRDLLRYFSQTFDSRTPKDEALTFIARRHGNKGVVFFGDSIGDLSAARTSEVGFVAVIAEWDNFQGRDVVKLHDFTEMGAVQRSIAQAVVEYAI